MSKQDTIQIDYTTHGDNYQFKLPLNIDYMIPKDDSVRLLSQIIEEMNLEKLYKTYSRIRGNRVTPRQLLKIIIYANMNCIYSSRKIEQACKRDINFMYLLGGACSRPFNNCKISQYSFFTSKQKFACTVYKLSWR